MTKTYSKAAKLRAKRAMPTLAAAPRKSKRGKARMSERKGDMMSVVLEARARQMGLPKSEAHKLRRERLSEDAGRAIDLLCEPEAADRIWGHWKALTGAEARHIRRKMSMGIYPKTADFEMMVERFEARDDDTVDLRTEEEKDADADRANIAWDARIAQLPMHCRTVIATAKREWKPMVTDGKATRTGYLFIDAMERLDLTI